MYKDTNVFYHLSEFTLCILISFNSKKSYITIRNQRSSDCQLCPFIWSIRTFFISYRLLFTDLSYYLPFFRVQSRMYTFHYSRHSLFFSVVLKTDLSKKGSRQQVRSHEYINLLRPTKQERRYSYRLNLRQRKVQCTLVVYLLFGRRKDFTLP